jgi:hypothetical protein
MKKWLVTSAVVMSIAGCGTSSEAPGGFVDDDTGAAVDDTGGTTGDDTGTPATDSGTEPTDSDTTMTDGSMPPTDSGVPPADAGDTGTAGCAKPNGTQAVHVKLNVSWKGTLAITAGSGVAHLWTKSVFTTDASGKITATQTACGSVIPDITTTAIAGGSKVQPEFLPAVWTSTKMPSFMTTGTSSGLNVGDTVTMNPVAVILGTTLADPGGAWPAATALVGQDHDGDGHLGITSTPKNGGGYTRPPTSLAMSARADLLYIASRATSGTSGKRTSCDATSGTATVTKFDNHVIGCHVAGGGECSASESKFVDDNRTVFVLGTATYESKVIPDGSSCDAVRAALP